MTNKVARNSPFLVLALLASTLLSTGYDYEIRSVGYPIATAIANDGRIGVIDGYTGHVLAGSVSQWSLAYAGIAEIGPGGFAAAGSYYVTASGTSSTLANGEWHAVSDGGLAVGKVGTQAAEWTGSGSSVPLPTPAGWSNTVAWGISPAGRYVVGHGQDPASVSRAVLWDRQQGTFVQLDDDVQLIGGGNASLWAMASDVNDAGEVAGRIGYPGFAVRWTKTPQGWIAQHLGPNLAESCIPSAINRGGTIVGRCKEKAFIWRPGEQKLTLLQSLVEPNEWQNPMSPRSINDLGQIVGKGRNAQGQWEGFVITPKSACIRPCTFSDGVTLRVPLDQCNPLGGTLPVGTHECIVNSQAKASSINVKPLGPD